MELAGFVLAVIGLLLAIISIALVFAVERARAPRIVIEPGERRVVGEEGLEFTT
jgi:hypothetical protein